MQIKSSSLRNPRTFEVCGRAQKEVSNYKEKKLTVKALYERL